MTTNTEYARRWARLQRTLAFNAYNLDAQRERLEIEKAIDARFQQIFTADSAAMSRLAADVEQENSLV